jgi:transcriptional regulator with XRE-family HTH domain
MAGDVDIAELPLDSAGRQLKRAREAAGKTLADISATTRISERLLAAIEESQYASLPSRTYAIGFSRSYARLVGLDEAAIVSEVRAEIDSARAGGEISTPPAFAPGDPARVPGRRLAMTAGLGALAVVVGGLVFWQSAYNPAGLLPSILPADSPPVAKSDATTEPATTRAGIAAPASPVPPAGGAVSISALSDGIWVKVYEASGKTLFEGQMALGQSFAVPADAQAPLIWTGRPDALAIAIAGQPVPKLSETQKTMKAVPISATALLARNLPPSAAAGPIPAMAPTAAE